MKPKIVTIKVLSILSILSLIFCVFMVVDVSSGSGLVEDSPLYKDSISKGMGYFELDEAPEHSDIIDQKVSNETEYLGSHTYIWENDTYIGESGEVTKNGGKVLDFEYSSNGKWDSFEDEYIVVGEYHTRENNTFVHYSEDGENWTKLFELKDFYPNLEQGDLGHVHDVVVNPFDNDTIIVQVGDNSPSRGIFLTEDRGETWYHQPFYTTAVFASSSMENGGLLGFYKDNDTFISFTEPRFTGFRFDIDSKRLYEIASFGVHYEGYSNSDYYTEGGTEEDYEHMTRSPDGGLIDRDTGVMYLTSVNRDTERDETVGDALYISVDGLIWYQVWRDAPFDAGGNNARTPRLINDSIHFEDGSLDLLDRKEAESLIYHNFSYPHRFTLSEQRKVQVGHPDTSQDIEMDVKGREIDNILGMTSDSFEDSDGIIWEGQSNLTTDNSFYKSEPHSLRVNGSTEVDGGEASIDLSEDITDGYYSFGFSIATDIVDMGERFHNGIYLGVNVSVVYSDGDSNTVRNSFAPTENEFYDYLVHFIITEDKTLDKVEISWDEGEDYSYWFDNFFLSKNYGRTDVGGNFINQTTNTKDAVLRIDNEKYDIGDLKTGDKYILTLEDLNSEFELLSGGLVDLYYHLVDETNPDETEDDSGTSSGSSEVDDNSVVGVFEISLVMLFILILISSAFYVTGGDDKDRK